MKNEIVIGECPVTNVTGFNLNKMRDLQSKSIFILEN